MVQKKSYQLISRLLCFFIVVTFELYRTSFCLFCFFVYLLTFLVFSIKSFKTVPSYDTSKYSPKQVYRTDVVAIVSIVKMKNFTFLDTFFLLPPTPFASLSFLSRVLGFDCTGQRASGSGRCATTAQSDRLLLIQWGVGDDRWGRRWRRTRGTRGTLVWTRGRQSSVSPWCI